MNISMMSVRYLSASTNGWIAPPTDPTSRNSSALLTVNHAMTQPAANSTTTAVMNGIA